MAKVLVTGGSGFIGGHCILQLLEAGHEVRTTVRSLAKEGAVRAMIATGGWTGSPERLSFAAANLEQDAGWAEAVAGCDYVLHVASPFPASVPKDENELIAPAREGALRLLRAARDARVRRVVLTSSFAAIGYGHPQRSTPFTESDWTKVEGDDTTAYAKSKTLAERAAWDFIAREGGAMELATVNPVGVFGPVLGPDFSTSILLTQRLLNGDVPGCPNLSFGGVDVRDVADLHIRAMIDPAAKGERFLAVAGEFVSMIDMALMLKRRMGPAGARVPTRRLPNWVVRLIGTFDPAVKVIAAEVGKVKNATSEKAQRVLEWRPRSLEDSLAASGESLLALGLLKVAKPR